MNVLEAIQKRRSVRQYKPDPVPDDALDRLLNALRLAPSGSNRQPWRFIVVRDPAVKVRLAEACHFRRMDGQAVTQKWVAEAPVVIVACATERAGGVRLQLGGRWQLASWSEVDEELRKGPVRFESSLHQDLAIALDHLSLAATAEGLGTCWIGGLDEADVKAALSIPEGVRAPLAMTLGYPAAWPEARPRKPLSEIICYDRYE
jgi:nitroreductase